MNTYLKETGGLLVLLDLALVPEIEALVLVVSGCRHVCEKEKVWKMSEFRNSHKMIYNTTSMQRFRGVNQHENYIATGFHR